MKVWRKYYVRRCFAPPPAGGYGKKLIRYSLFKNKAGFPKRRNPASEEGDENYEQMGGYFGGMIFEFFSPVLVRRVFGGPAHRLWYFGI